MIKTAQKIKMLKIKDIIPNPYQIRRNFAQKELESLSQSIKEVGILSPLIVRRNTNGYELICGQRRHRAAIMAGLDEVPAIIIRAGDVQCAEISLIENIHRKNIGIFEEAEGFYNLVMYHKIKKDRLQKDITVDSLKINERVQLLSFTADARLKMETAEIDERYIKQILRIRSDVERTILINKIVNDKLSYYETENYVNSYLKESVSSLSEKTGKRKTSKDKTPLYDNTVKKTVELLKKNGAKVDFSRNDTEEYVEYSIKTLK